MPARNLLPILTMLLAVSLPGFSGDSDSIPPSDPGSFSNTDVQFHCVVPLGTEALQLEPNGQMLMLLASATSPDFEGMERQPSDQRVLLSDSAGHAVRKFPQTVDFRVTITSDALEGLSSDPVPYLTGLSPEEIMLGLGFRVKVFHGLDSSYLGPERVEQIGPPADVPAGERIFIAHFSLDSIPAEDRLVLEVLDPSGA